MTYARFVRRVACMGKESKTPSMLQHATITIGASVVNTNGGATIVVKVHHIGPTVAVKIDESYAL